MAKRWQTITELKRDGWSESQLRRIARSDEAHKYCRRTSERGKYQFDIYALNSKAPYLDKIGGINGNI